MTTVRLPARRKRTPESLVLKAVTDLLSAERIPHWRMNAGDRFGSYRGKRWRIRGHAPGTADLLVVPEVHQTFYVGNEGTAGELVREAVRKNLYTKVRHPLWLEVK